MDLRVGAVQEADIVFSGAGHKHTGGTDGNTLGLDAINVDEQSAENAGVVTLTTGSPGYEQIAALASMNVVAGDRIFVTGVIYGTKGATAGLTELLIRKSSGTATIAVGNDQAIIEYDSNVGANIARWFAIAGCVKVTGSGTLVLELAGDSAGSDTTIAAGNGQLHALVLRGVG